MRLHRKKLTIFLLAFATLLTWIFLVIYPREKNRLCSFFPESSRIRSEQTSDDACELTLELSSSLLRLRVLADSDSQADQEEKQFLCSKLIPLLSTALSKAKTKEEAVAFVRESLPFLNAYCNYVLMADGTVSCTLGPHLFPYKTYGDYQFPSGIYDTLLITIGNGSGSNWWCLAFPPLCFADEAFVDVPDSSAQTLQDLLSDDAYAQICIEKPKLTFGLFSLFKKWAE